MLSTSRKQQPVFKKDPTTLDWGGEHQRLPSSLHGNRVPWKLNSTEDVWRKESCNLIRLKVNSLVCRWNPKLTTCVMPPYASRPSLIMLWDDILWKLLGNTASPFSRLRSRPIWFDECFFFYFFLAQGKMVLWKLKRVITEIAAWTYFAGA